MRTRFTPSTFAVLCLMLALPHTSSGSTFTTFDVPGGISQAAAVNKWGSVTGYYNPTNGSGINGFIYQASSGVVTTFSVPGVSLTYPLSINDTGWVVGYYLDKSGVNHGFLRNPKFTTLDVPGAGTLSGQGTQAFSINDAGEIAGVYFDTSGYEHGFVRDASGNYTSFDVPGDSWVESAWLNQSGQVGGTYYANSVNHGYIMATDGTFTTFDAPGSSTLGIFVGSINASGETTGVYYPAGSGLQEFVRDQYGNITTFSIPYFYTVVGIEDNGDVIGMKSHLSQDRGWKWTPAGVVTYFNDASAGNDGTNPTCVSGNGKVAGTYFDSGGKIHGFLMTN